MNAAAPELAPLDIVDPITLDGLPVPPRRWLVEDWIPLGVVTSLYGDGGLGKSLLAQMLGTAAACGLDWLGMPVTRCKVLAVFCEDDKDELHRRQAAICQHYAVDFADLECLRWVSRVGHDNLLMTFDEGARGNLTAFYTQIATAAQAFGAQLIIVDTAADTFGGNENARPQVRQFIQALGRLAQQIDGAVLLLAHPSRSGLASGQGDGGSTGWNNSVRSRLYLSRPEADPDSEPDQDARTLATKKANYSRSGQDLKLRWKDGVFVREGGPIGGVFGLAQRKHAERVFLDLLDKVTAEGRYVSDSKNSGNYVPALFAKRPDRRGLDRKAFISAMEGLFSDGIIVVKEYGKPSNPHRYVARAPEEDLDEADPDRSGPSVPVPSRFP